ncbi:unnamed protein product, partial [Bubo scandiacus]
MKIAGVCDAHLPPPASAAGAGPQAPRTLGTGQAEHYPPPPPQCRGAKPRHSRRSGVLRGAPGAGGQGGG